MTAGIVWHYLALSDFPKTKAGVTAVVLGFDARIATDDYTAGIDSLASLVFVESQRILDCFYFAATVFSVAAFFP